MERSDESNKKGLSFRIRNAHVQFLYPRGLDVCLLPSRGVIGVGAALGLVEALGLARGAVGAPLLELEQRRGAVGSRQRLAALEAHGDLEMIALKRRRRKRRKRRRTRKRRKRRRRRKSAALEHG